MRSKSVEALRPEAEARGSAAEPGRFGENGDGEEVAASGERGETGSVRGEATGIVLFVCFCFDFFVNPSPVVARRRRKRRRAKRVEVEKRERERERVFLGRR